MIKPREKERRTKASKKASEFKSLEKSNYVGDRELLETLDQRRMILVERLEGSSMKVFATLSSLQANHLTAFSPSSPTFPPSWTKSWSRWRRHFASLKLIA